MTEVEVFGTSTPHLFDLNHVVLPEDKTGLKKNNSVSPLDFKEIPVAPQSNLSSKSRLRTKARALQ